MHKCENVALKPIAMHNLVDASDNINCFKGLSVESRPVFLLWLPRGWGGPAGTILTVAAKWLQNNLEAQIPPIGVDWFMFLFVICFACPTHVNKKPDVILILETPFSQEDLLSYFPLPDNRF